MSYHKMKEELFALLEHNKLQNKSGDLKNKDVVFEATEEYLELCARSDCPEERTQGLISLILTTISYVYEVKGATKAEEFLLVLRRGPTFEEMYRGVVKRKALLSASLDPGKKFWTKLSLECRLIPCSFVEEMAEFVDDLGLVKTGSNQN